MRSILMIALLLCFVVFNSIAQIGQFEGDLSLVDGTPAVNLYVENEYRGRLISAQGDVYLDAIQDLWLTPNEDLILFGDSFKFIPKSGDDAIVTSNLSQSGGDMFLVSNDAVIAQINKNLNSQGNFFVWDGNSTNLFQVTYNGNVYAQGTLFNGSDKNRKEYIKAISYREILRALVKMPVYQWQYKDEESKHIGPMAQDFYMAFGLGKDDKTIATIDADGIALAAIKAQQDLIQEQQTEITSLREDLEVVKEELSRIRELISVYENHSR